MQSFSNTSKFSGLSSTESHAPKHHSTQLSLERLDGMLTGLALGDSLGLPVETLSADEIRSRFGSVRSFLNPLINRYMAEYQPPIGVCSDDVQLTRALFEAYNTAGGFSLTAIADAHVDAYQTTTLGWGNSTKRGVELVMSGVTPGTPEFARRIPPATGNGIPMKVAAIAAWAVAHGDSLEAIAPQVQLLCSLTHPTTMCVSAGLAHIAALQYCLTVEPGLFSKEEFISRVVAASAIGRNFYPETLTQDDITLRLATIGEVSQMGSEAIITSYDGGGCYVYQSLPFALAFFLTGPDDPETIYRVIEAGGDTDSNGAMVGALQGAIHGQQLFSSQLISEIRGLSELLQVGHTFLKRIQSV